MIDNKKIAARLVKLRGKKSRKEIALAIGVSKSAIAMYERGERIPKDDIKIKYAQIFNTTVNELFFN